MAIVEKSDEFMIEFDGGQPYIAFYDSDFLEDNIIEPLSEKIIKEALSDDSSWTETNVFIKQKMDNLLDYYIEGRRFFIPGDEIIFDTEYESEVIKLKECFNGLLKKLESIKFSDEDEI